MIHKKGGRIRTYGRPAPDLLGWVAGLAPLVASVPETDALRYPVTLSPLLLLLLCNYELHGTFSMPTQLILLELT